MKRCTIPILTAASTAQEVVDGAGGWGLFPPPPPPPSGGAVAIQLRRRRRERVPIQWSLGDRAFGALRRRARHLRRLPFGHGSAPQRAQGQVEWVTRPGLTLTLPGLPEETTERPSTAYTVVGLRHLLKAKGAPSEGPKAELSRKLAEFQDGPDLDLVEPSSSLDFIELMETYSRRAVRRAGAPSGGCQGPAGDAPA